MKRQELKSDDQYLNVRMSAELHRWLRIKAAEDETSMTHLVNIVLEEKRAELEQKKP